MLYSRQDSWICFMEQDEHIWGQNIFSDMPLKKANSEYTDSSFALVDVWLP